MRNKAVKTVDRRVPPVYTDFIFNYTSLFGDGREYRYENFVHYNEDMTAFETWARMDEKKILCVEVDYNTVNEGDVGVSCSANIMPSAISAYGEDWCKEKAAATTLLTLAIQAYLLYFQPEITTRIYAESHPAAKPAVKKRQVNEPVKILPKHTRRIYLTERDRPDRTVTYHKLAWSVRGHYRHVGKDRRLKYVQPYKASRAGKDRTAKPKKYIIEDK